MRSSVVLVALFAVGVWSHSALNNPTAWNPNPSKTSPCGGGSALRVGQNTPYWMPGDTITDAVQWQVIAGDGTGALTFTVDVNTNGGVGQGFTRDITSAFTGPTPNAVGTYRYNFVVPSDLTCTGGLTQNLCSLQVRSTSNWFACTTIAVGAPVNGTGNTPAQPTRVLATELYTCTGVNNKTVMVPPGTDIYDMEIGVNLTLSSYLPNKNVFSHSDQAGCREAFTAYLCGATYRLPTQPTVPLPCFQACMAFREKCGLNITHNNLYPCGTNTGIDSFGRCTQWTYGSGSSTGGQQGDDTLRGAASLAQPAALLAALLAMLAAALRF